jgi:hypothetical protein
MTLTHRSAASRIRRDPERLRGHCFPFSFHPLACHRSRIYTILTSSMDVITKNTKNICLLHVLYLPVFYFFLFFFESVYTLERVWLWSYRYTTTSYCLRINTYVCLYGCPHVGAGVVVM